MSNNFSKVDYSLTSFFCLVLLANLHFAVVNYVNLGLKSVENNLAFDKTEKDSFCLI